MSIECLNRPALILLLAALLSACAMSPQPQTAKANAAEYAPEPDEADDVTTASSGVTFADVAETYVSDATPEHNVDSPASWRAPDGATWVLASAKATDQVLVYDGDSGALLRAVGSTGADGG